jgi:hypothetical protein
MPELFGMGPTCIMNRMRSTEILKHVLQMVERFDPSVDKPSANANYEVRGKLITIAAMLAMECGMDGVITWWTPDPTDEDYFIQYICLTGGRQLSWHMSNSEARVGPNRGWDGHTTEQKYKIIRSL